MRTAEPSVAVCALCTGRGAHWGIVSTKTCGYGLYGGAQGGGQVRERAVSKSKSCSMGKALTVMYCGGVSSIIGVTRHYSSSSLSLISSLLLLTYLHGSDSVCASASVRTMSEDIKKALSYNHTTPFRCQQLPPIPSDTAEVHPPHLPSSALVLRLSSVCVCIDCIVYRVPTASLRL